MNKKVNTLLFVLGATIVNILIMLIIVVFGLVLLGRLPEHIQESVGQILFVLLFLVAIGGSFYAYHKIIGYVSKKIDMDKYFHPIFKPRQKQ